MKVILNECQTDVGLILQRRKKCPGELFMTAEGNREESEDTGWQGTLGVGEQSKNLRELLGFI